MASWTNLTFAFGSLLTSTKMTQLDANLDALAEGASGAPDIELAALITTTGEVSTTATTFTKLTLPGGTNGFFPQIKMSVTTAGNWGALIITQGVSQAGFTTYATVIMLLALTSTTIFAQQKYFSGSPPYKIGDSTWGHFLFLLRKISDGSIVATYEAPDPPWQYNGKTWLPKDDSDRILAIPHPFADYWLKDPATDGLEISLVDLRDFDTKQWKTDNQKLGKSILEDLPQINSRLARKLTNKSLGLKTIPGFSDKVIIRGI